MTETKRARGGVSLEAVLGAIEVGEPLAWKNIQVFPLSRSNGHDPAYALVDDLLDLDQVEVTEIGEGGTVPTIKVLNKSDFDALILDGLELRGAKQNRMVNLTIIAGKHAETEIPVACVEAGRWSHRSRGFASAKRTVGGKLRARKASMLADHFARHQRAGVDQGRVWNEVDHYLHAAHAASPTSAFEAAFDGHADEVEDSIRELERLEAHGAVVAVNGEIVSLDLFDSVETFKKVWPALLRGHGLDAVLEAGNGAIVINLAAVSSWLGHVCYEATATRYEVPGVGEYHVVRGAGLAGGIAVHGDTVVHAALFSVREGEEAWDEA